MDASTIHAGGLSVLLLGLALTVWALINIAWPRSAASIFLQCLLSLIPAIIAVSSIYGAHSRFMDLLVTDIAPERGELSSIAFGMSVGIGGTVATLVPVAIGLCAFWRHARRNESLGLQAVGSPA